METKQLPFFKISILIFSFLLSFYSFSQNTYNISDPEDLEGLNLSAGDEVILEDGTYNSDERILFSGSGTSSNPITFRAENPGGVIFNNGLQMDIAGTYLIVDGFYWNGGYGASNFIQFRNGTNYAQNCTIQNCAINGLTAEPGDAAEAAVEGAIIKHRWIVLYGNYNNVINCTFMNKNTAGALVLGEYEYNAEEDRCNEVGHTIMNNYFYHYEKIDPSLSNAGDSETIRIGTSEYQNVNSSVIVSGNYFVEADGENEIITNKSMNNRYLNNTFRRCRGSLVMRHGANATVDGNYFLGENVEGTGAIRITDSEHTVTNNYIQDCVTTADFAAWNNGLTFVGGNTSSVQDCNSTSVSNSYQDVENIIFSNNTFVNTDSPIYFNDSRDGADNVYGTVSNNVIYFDSGNNNSSNIITGAYSEIGNTLTFSGNVYEGTDLGESASGFSATNLTASSNGEIYTISGTGSAGASIASSPLTDSDVAETVGACFLDASGNLLSGCDGTIEPVDSLTVTSLSTFSSNGGSQNFSISSNVSWTVSESSSWVSVNATSGSDNGSVTVTVSENTATADRSTTITVSGSGITRTVTVNQDGTEDTTADCDDIDAFALNEAENYCDESGIDVDDANTYVGWIENGDWVKYENVDFGSGANAISILVSSSTSGGTLEIRQDSTSGTLLSSIQIPSTGSWTTWETISADVSNVSGIQDIYFVFNGGSGYLFNIDWFQFTEEDETDNTGDSDNLALNGTASQSSNYSATRGLAELAIDGNTDGNWNGRSVTHTAATTGSWWQVILEDEVSIGDIVIYNRTNSCCIDRLSNFTITITDSNDNQVFSETITSTPNPSLIVNAGDITGQTVRITTNLENTALSLAEVEVFEGENTNTDTSTNCTDGTNLSLNGSIVDFSDEQNTTNTVNNIIDGDDSNRWSALGFPQYAVIDLGDNYSINEINLSTYNDRGYEYTVEGSTTSATSGFSTLTTASGPGSNSFSTETVRFVKLTITDGGSYTGNWCSITDFEINCAGTSAKSIIADQTFEVTAFPNPFVNTINVNANANESFQTIGSIQLSDITGKIITTQKVASSNSTLSNLGNIAKGLYLLQVLNEQGQIINTIKIIKH